MTEEGGKNGARTSAQVLQSVVKLFVQYAAPNYCMPWQMKRQQQCFGSGFVIDGRRILTNAHVIKYHKSIRVRKHGDAKKYQAYILSVAHECDIAMVGVEDEKFWEDVNHLEFGAVPKLEEDVVVVGFPTGGDNLSVTRGVVSRVGIRKYSHSGQDLLAIQIDAAINAGNSGGPALQEGKVVGIAFQAMLTAENVGYIIPVSVIHHFLEDIEKNKQFSGFCDLGIRWQAIEAEQMRSYFKLSAEDTGVLVAKVPKLSCSHGYLKKGDILMSLDGSPIAENGTVLFRGDERIHLSYLLHSKFPSEIVKALIFRAGERLEINITLDLFTPLVPRQLYEKTPSYVVYCGLVFVILSQPYMHHQFGKDWTSKSPVRLFQRVYNYAERIEQEVVLLSQVLASELTAGYEAFGNLQLFRVNGIPVLNLHHLCYLLDIFTQPHVSENPQKDEPADLESSFEPKTVKGLQMLSTSCDSSHTIGEEGPGRNKPRAEDEIFTMPCTLLDDCSKITSFTNIDDDYNNCCKISQATGFDNKISSTSFSTYSQADHEKYREFCRTSPNFYAVEGEDESLLLDCENFIKFELDQNKIIVLNIKDAKENSHSILQQHAITHPRSTDMPRCLFQ